MLFSTDNWAIKSHDGLWPTDYEEFYSKDNHDNLVEKKTDVEMYETVDISHRKNIKKYGNRISYEIKIFDSPFKGLSLDDDLRFLEHIDGRVVPFYPNSIERPYNYQECFIYHVYDDCSRAPIHFIKLYLKRKRLEKLSAEIKILNTLFYDCFPYYSRKAVSVGTSDRLALTFTSSFTGIANIYIKPELGEYSIIANGIDIVAGNNYIDIPIEYQSSRDIGGSYSSLNYVKIESTEDYYIFDEAQFIIPVVHEVS